MNAGVSDCVVLAELAMQGGVDGTIVSVEQYWDIRVDMSN